jgi:hypothetical protein
VNFLNPVNKKGNDMFRNHFLSLVLVLFAVFSIAGSASAQQGRDWRKAEEEKKKQYEEERNKKIPKEKFRKVGAGEEKIKDEYIVALKADTPNNQIDQIVDGLSKKYKMFIKTAKQKDKDGKEVDYGIWRGQSLKGFVGVMDEATAKLLSEDPQVEYVSENRILKGFKGGQ